MFKDAEALFVPGIWMCLETLSTTHTSVYIHATLFRWHTQYNLH